jgi:hypothetical protein
MAFVGQTANPWIVIDDEAVPIMQKIWNATRSEDYTITTDTAIYKKVSDRLVPRTSNIIMCFRRFNASRTRGAMLSDPLASQWSWRSVIRKSICWTQMNIAYNLPINISSSIAFCTEMSMVMTARFVITTLIPLTSSNDSQKWKGLFRSPFVLQTFAAHLSAIDGCVRVPNLHDTPSPNAGGALGLAAASVCILYYACTFFSDHI